jgi:hypothetical protein
MNTMATFNCWVTDEDVITTAVEIDVYLRES